MTRTNPNAAIFMMLDVALSDALDDIEESRRACLYTNPRLQVAILKAADIVTKLRKLKNNNK